MENKQHIKQDLRIIFIGTPDFAVESLRCLLQAGKNVVAVITAPDRKAGRGRKINESAVKKFAVSKELAVLQPTNLKDPDFLKELASFKADLQIVVAFRMLPELVWNMPQHGTFNLHASLLPNYRGAAPINWAIINGEQETGVSTFFLKHAIDTGNLIFQEKTPISTNETAGSLHDKLMLIGGTLVVKTVDAIEEGNAPSTEQTTLLDDTIKDAPKIFKDDCKINWTNAAQDINRLIRGLSPYPAAWSIIKSNRDGKTLGMKIFSCQVVLHEKMLSPGEIIVHEQKVIVGCSDHYSLQIDELQVEGKKRMDAKSLLNGFKLDEYQFT